MVEVPNEHQRRSDRKVRPALRALAITGVIVISGCTSSSVDVTNKGAAVPSSTKAAPRSTVANTVKNVSATTAPGDTSVTVPGVDAAATLKAALDALRPAYDVVETVTVNGKVAFSITGRVVGSGSVLTLTSGGASIEYLEVPPKSWSREQGGSWAEMTAPVPVKVPLDLFGQASALAVSGQQAGETHLHATYDPALFGLKDNPIQADIVLGANGVLTAAYPTVVADKPGTVDARLSPSADQTPIASPS